MATGDGGRRSGRRSASASLTIEQLSERTGMSVRNIRAHQSRGLLPHPARSGRVGYYSQAHVERLLLIRQLQAQGFNLASIAAVLDASGGSRTDHRSLQRIALAPLLRNDPAVLPRSALSRMFSHPKDDDNLRRAEQAGLLRVVGDDRVELPSRPLAAAAQELIALGLEAEEVLDLQVRLLRGTASVAEQFVELCLRRAWDPFADEGFPPARWRQVRDAFERLHEQTTIVLLATFALSVRSAAERRLRDDPAPHGKSS